jgi:hypothetical protein
MWKSQNFPANYNSDQATPALHEESTPSATPSWWDDQELGTAAMDNEPHPVPLHPDLLHDFVMNNSFDEDDDEYISDYIDLILFAIVTQMERQKTYLLNPTSALLEDIRTHSTYISRAESSLNVHIVRIIRNFKASINYDAWMSGTLTAEGQIVPSHTAKTQFNEIDTAHEGTNDANLHDIETAKESTTNAITHKNLNDSETAKECTTTDITQNNLNDIEIAKECTVRYHVYYY